MTVARDAVRDFGFALALFALLCLALRLTGCSPRPMTTTEKKVTAEATYGAELQRCVYEHDCGGPCTRKDEVAIDACAAEVRRRWDAKDGGK